MRRPSSHVGFGPIIYSTTSPGGGRERERRCDLSTVQVYVPPVLPDYVDEILWSMLVENDVETFEEWKNEREGSQGVTTEQLSHGAANVRKFKEI